MRATPEVESRFWVGCCEATTDTQDAGPGRAAVFTAASPLHPTRNEDGAAVFSLGDCAVIAVADGVGGLPGGDAAAAHALEALGSSLDEVRDTPDSRRVRDALLDGFELGHARIRDTDCGATTLACVELRPDSFRTYHAGDSAVLVIDRVGMIKQQTVPHSPVGYAMESGLIDEDEALFHPKRNVIFKCLGREHMGLELSMPSPLEPEDTVLVASDGLLDNLTLAEIVDVLRDHDVTTAAKRLGELARQRMGTPVDPLKPSKPDDVTLAVYRPR